jgi:hypothetical protein
MPVGRDEPYRSYFRSNRTFEEETVLDHLRVAARFRGPHLPRFLGKWVCAANAMDASLAGKAFKAGSGA